MGISRSDLHLVPGNHWLKALSFTSRGIQEKSRKDLSARQSGAGTGKEEIAPGRNSARGGEMKQVSAMATACPVRGKESGRVSGIERRGGRVLQKDSPREAALRPREKAVL